MKRKIFIIILLLIFMTVATPAFAEAENGEEPREWPGLDDPIPGEPKPLPGTGGTPTLILQSLLMLLSAGVLLKKAV